MAEGKRKKSSPFVVVAFLLALVALALSVIVFSRVYNIRSSIGELQERLQRMEESAEKSKESRRPDLKAIGRKIAEAKDSIVKKEGRTRAMERLREARDMMKEYKNRLAPALQKRWEQVMDRTETAAELLKDKAADVGEELDRLAGSVERFFEDEKEEPETEKGEEDKARDSQEGSEEG